MTRGGAACAPASAGGWLRRARRGRGSLWTVHRLVRLGVLVVVSGASTALMASPAVALTDVDADTTVFTIPEATPLYPGAGVDGGFGRSDVVGPDGNIWFPDNGPGMSPFGSGVYPTRLGRMTPSGTFLPPYEVGEAIVEDTTRGPDGNVWYPERISGGPGGAAIVRVDAQGKVTRFPVCGQRFCSLSQIAAGPDGNIWFTREPFVNGEPQARIGRLSLATGKITEFTLPPADLRSLGGREGGLTAGPDGNVWFIAPRINKIGRITPSGQVTEFDDQHGEFEQPRSITSFAGHIWVGYSFSTVVRRFTPDGDLVDSYDSGYEAPYHLTPGPDGVYYATGFVRTIEGVTPSTIQRITAAGEVTRYHLPGDEVSTVGLVLGPDGRIWFRQGSKQGDGRLRSMARLENLDSPQPPDLTSIPTNLGSAFGPKTVSGPVDCPNDPAEQTTIDGNLVVNQGPTNWCFANQATINGDVTISAHSFAALSHVHVTGRVIVKDGGEAVIDHTRIEKGIVADNANFVDVLSSDVTGGISSTGSTLGLTYVCGSIVRGSQTSVGTTSDAFPQIFGDPDGGCAANDLRGGATLSDNKTPLMLEGNTVRGSITLTNNHSAITITNNTISGALECTGNTVQPTGSGNSARKVGQCVGL